MPLLNVQNLSFSYHTLSGEQPALSNISFQVNSGEFLAVVGPSGCGKTTLISLIAGLLVPEEGNITFDSYQSIGYMLQKDHLLEWRSIKKNVELGLEIKKSKNSESKKNIETLLKEYDLYEFKDKKPLQLSGGMRQRAALIRTLATQPSLLLLDEPFSALDYITRLKVAADIVSIIKKQHKTAIMITHDLSEAVTFSDRILILSTRPATIKSEIHIDLPSDRSNPLYIQSLPKYQIYLNRLWEEIKEHE